MSVKLRIELEKKIAAAVAEGLIGAGYLITVNDGEEDVLFDSKDPAAIAAAMMSTDEDYFYVSKEPSAGKTWFGWVRFIYGNDGYDVVSDYTVNLENPVGPISKEWYDKYA